eukprot:gnl/MRDRNA2_/MRDRNA2_35467_c0_seq1.p1 gnl/MRDRNA2_/MRDRNA2_35467_c0~~gnl/MRDRNA2_/MRDRNA2_35467_c0_seq1.p1  ORF type:complete len:828 (-),score=145.53 gnl/MRDRNA2_/MRDRNA2_35467_c0_seq1:382-2865(-)
MQHGTNDDNQIAVLLQRIHTEQLERLDVLHAKLEQRITEIVQNKVEVTQRPSQEKLLSTIKAMQGSSCGLVSTNSRTSQNSQLPQDKLPISSSSASGAAAAAAAHFASETSKHPSDDLNHSQNSSTLLPTPLSFDAETGFYHRSKKKKASILAAKDDDSDDAASPNAHYYRSHTAESKKGIQTKTFDMLQKVFNFERSADVVANNTHRISAEISGSAYGSFKHAGILRSTMASVMQHKWTETTVLAVIMANTIYMAWHTDWIAKELEEPGDVANRVIELFFTTFFTLDISLRLYVEQGEFLHGGNWRWNILDSIVVITALLEEVLNILSSQSSAVSSTKVVRVIRVLRLIRLIRFIRGAAFFTELRALCLGIFETVSSLFWALVLLGINIFIFSIYLTQGVAYHLMERIEDGADEDAVKEDGLRDSYGSLLTTMYSLWKALTGGADWEAYCDPLFDVSTLMGVIFVFFIAFAVCALFNVVTGIFVNKALKVAEGDMELTILANNKDRKEHIQHVRRVFKRADVNKNGYLTKQEFMDHFNDPFVHAFFQGLGLDLDSVTPDQLFGLLDFNGDGDISWEEFVYGCSTFKGAAKNLDLLKLKHDVHRNAQEHAKVIARMAAVQKDNTKEIQKVAQLLDLSTQLGYGFGHAQQEEIPAELSQIKAAANCNHIREAACSQSKAVAGCTVNLADVDVGEHLKPCAMAKIDVVPEPASDLKIVHPVLQTQADQQYQEKVTPQDTRFQVFFGESVKTLGFTIEWRSPVPVVGSIDANGEAEMHGVCTGDLIEEVNYQQTGDVFREELLPHFQVRPLTLSFYRQSNEESPMAIDLL